MLSTLIIDPCLHVNVSLLILVLMLMSPRGRLIVLFLIPSFNSSSLHANIAHLKSILQQKVGAKVFFSLQ